MRSWLKPSAVRSLSPTEAAWLAGFFDGEGSLVLRLGTGRNGHNSCRLSISSTNRAALARVRELTNAGSVGVKPTRRQKNWKPHYKPQWIWQASRQRDVVAILRQMEPYLTIKRPAAVAHLAAWRDVG